MTDERSNEQIIQDAIRETEYYDDMLPADVAAEVAEALVAAGRLVTPQHDAQVRGEDHRTIGIPYSTGCACWFSGGVLSTVSPECRLHGGPSGFAVGGIFEATRSEEPS